MNVKCRKWNKKYLKSFLRNAYDQVKYFELKRRAKKNRLIFVYSQNIKSFSFVCICLLSFECM